jgi:hypothetical protein
MPMSMLIQLVAASTGVIGSMFFAIGVMRQTVSAMADLSGTYFDWNPHMVTALAAQKADYLFGGGIIVVAFSLQLLSFLVSPENVVPQVLPSGAVPWIVVVATVIIFLFLLRVANNVARRFEAQIYARLKEKSEILRRELEEQQRAAVQRKA